MSNKIVDRSYKRNKNYRYNIGDIIETKNSKIIIIGKTKVIESGKNVKAYNCKCLIDKHEFIHTENYIDHKRDCPVCCNRVIIKGINDISTTHPHLVKYFSDVNDAYTHSYGSNKYAIMKCPNCGFEKPVKICRLFADNYSCSRCSDGLSYPNKFMLSVLLQLDIKFTNEYLPRWSNGRKYDFYFIINNKKYIIEMDGEFHTKEHTLSQLSIEEINKIDTKKDIMAEQHKIRMIRIDCCYDATSNRFEYIKNNVINSVISKILNLDNVDWNKCNEYATNSLVKEVCIDYNNNIPLSDIADKYYININTIRSYLKQGCIIFDWIDYNPQEKIIENGKKSAAYNPRVKPLICNETNQIFSGASEFERVTKLLGSTFYRRYTREVCEGKISSYKGFTFKYITKQEFNTIKTQSPELAFGDFFILPEETKEEQNIA